MNFLSTATITFLLGFVGLAIIALPSVGETVNIGRSDEQLVIPSGYSASTKSPLVILLHGYTSNGAAQESYLKFSELADEYNFLLLTPDGTIEQFGDQNRFWNATAACCNFYNSNVDDSAYLSDLIAEMQSSYNVDENRIFLIGHSNGGFMSHRMAYDHPETIAAIASLAGASLLEMIRSTPDRPVSILQIHGTADATISFEGGSILGNDYPSADRTLTNWIDHNGATLDPTELQERLDLEASIPGDETIVTQYSNDGTIELWTIQGGGHVPQFTDNFNRGVINWLYSHPKTPVDNTTALFTDEVQKMYIAYYGRAGDPAGIAFWADELTHESGDLSSIIESFGNSEEYSSRFSSLENSQLVDNIYLQLFGRSADLAGLDFYTGRLDSGDYTLASIALEIANGIEAGTDDSIIYNNKLAVANAFTDAVGTSAAHYDADDISAVVALLSGVDVSSVLSSLIDEVTVLIDLLTD
jgi:polyhydroxybutyrate depolymerase